jgi:RNA polymerase sigma-70 factor, ECF subfamily
VQNEAEILKCLEETRYREALERIVSHYRDTVLHVCYAVTGNAALAEEAAQEAFVRVWKGLPGFRRESSVGTWIHTIARNAALRYARANRQPGTVPLEEFDVPAGPPAGFQAGGGAIDVAHLISCLDRRYRPVVMLYYMEGRSYEETARLLGLPMGTVKTYLHRARKQLAEIVMAAKVPGGGQ